MVSKAEQTSLIKETTLSKISYGPNAVGGFEHC